MIRFLLDVVRYRLALARYPDRLLRDIGIDVAETDRWSPLPAPAAGQAGAERYMMMAPLRS